MGHFDASNHGDEEQAQPYSRLSSKDGFVYPTMSTKSETTKAIVEYAIVDKNGVVRQHRPVKYNFFGPVSDPYTAEDIAKCDREMADCAPHKMITL